MPEQADDNSIYLADHLSNYASRSPYMETIGPMLTKNDYIQSFSTRGITEWLKAKPSLLCDLCLSPPRRSDVQQLLAFENSLWELNCTIISAKSLLDCPLLSAKYAHRMRQHHYLLE